MAKRCVNINNLEFKILVKNTGIKAIPLASRISLWQDQNNTDRFPTAEEIVSEFKLQKGINFVFEQNSELEVIGSKEQYSKYLNTIFPNSKVKDIVYHGTKSKDKFDKFNITKESIGRGAWFTGTKRRAQLGGGDSKRIFAVLLDIRDPKYKDGSGAALVNNPDKYLKKSDGSRYDAAIFEPTAPKDLTDLKSERITLKLNQIIVFQSEQIYILGSSQDAKNFEKFIDKEQPAVKNLISSSTVITENQVNLVKSRDFETKLAELDKTFQTTIRQAIEEDPNIKRNKVFAEINKKLNAFLEKMGISVKSVSTILDINGEPIDAVSKADIINKLIEINEDKRDFSTLPEEAAHFFVELLGENHPLFRTMMDKITKFNIYDEVRSEYSDAYGDDIDKYKKEAIAKLISINILNELPLVNETTNNQNIFARWFRLAWNALTKLFSNVNSKDMAPFIQSAKNILDGKIDNLIDFGDIIDEAERTDKNLTFYQLSEEAIVNREEIIQSLNNKMIRRDGQGGFVTNDGKKVNDTVSNQIREAHLRRFRYEGISPDKNDTTSATKTTYIHKLNKLIMDRISLGEDVIGIKSDIENIVRIGVRELQDEVPNIDKILKATPKFFNITERQFAELVDGVNSIYEQILENNIRINKSLDIKTDVKPKIYTEVALYSENEDLANEVDILVIYANGMAGTYKYAATQLKSISKFEKKFRSLSEYQLDDYDMILGQAKRILQNQYGIQDFTESRVIPINMQFQVIEGKKNKNGFFSIEFDSRDREEEAYLKQIPVAKELTEDKELNKSLNKMLTSRDNLKNRLRQDKTNIRLQLKFERINKAIKSLQLDRDVSYIFREITFLQSDFNRRMNAPVDSPDHLELYQINDYWEYLHVYSEFALDASKLVENLKDKRLVARMESINFQTGKLAKKILSKLIERVNLIDSSDITADIEETGGLGKLFKQLKDLEPAAFKKLSTLVIANYEQKRQKINDLIEIVTEKDSAVKEWAKKNGVSRFDAFRNLIDVSTGDLTTRFEKSYEEDYKKAIENKNKTWIIANTTFDEEAFNKNKKVRFDYLDSIHPTEKLDDLRTKLVSEKETLSEIELEDLKDEIKTLEGNEDFKNTLKEEWKLKFDVKFNNSAYYYPRNTYLRLEDKSSRYNEKWKFLNKKENGALLDYYNMYISMNEIFNDISNREVNSTFVNELRQDTIDRLFQTGLKGMRDFKFNLLHALETRQFDISKREFDPVTGKSFPIVPLFGTDRLRDPITSDELKIIQEDLVKEGFDKTTLEYKVELTERVREKEYEKGREFKSIDLSRSLILFAENVYVNEAMHETEDAARAIQTLFHEGVANTILTDSTGNKLVNKAKGYIAKLLGVDKSDLETLDNYVDMYWYGLHTQNKDLEIFKTKPKYDKDGILISEGKTYSGNRLASMIMQYVSLSRLALKIIPATGNAFGIFSNAYMMGAEKLHYSNKQIEKAFKLMIKGDKITHAAKLYFEPSARNLTYQKANNLSANWFTRNLTMENMFIFFKVPDDAIDTAILSAMMQNHGFDGNGKFRRLNKLEKGTKSLYELSSIKDSKFNVKGLSEKEFIKFRSKVRYVSTRIKGSIPEDSKNTMNTHIIRQALMQFRNWIPGLATARFAKLTYDKENQELDVGRFRVAAGEILQASGIVEKLLQLVKLGGEVLLSLPIVSLLDKSGIIFNNNKRSQATQYYYNKFLVENPQIRKADLTIDDFLELRIAKLNGVAKEIAIILTFWMIYSLAKAAIPDDDEDTITKNLARNSYKAIRKGLLEVTFFTDPTSMQSLLHSPMASFSTIIDIKKLLVNTVDVALDLPKADENPYKAISKKGAKDRTPPFYYLSNQIPVLNTVVDFLNIFDKPLPK